MQLIEPKRAELSKLSFNLEVAGWMDALLSELQRVYASAVREGRLLQPQPVQATSLAERIVADVCASFDYQQVVDLCQELQLCQQTILN